MCSTCFRGKNDVIAGHEHYLKKVRIRLFVPHCKLDFGSHLWDATAHHCEEVNFGRCKQNTVNILEITKLALFVHIGPTFCMFEVFFAWLAANFLRFGRSTFQHIASQ